MIKKIRKTERRKQDKDGLFRRVTDISERSEKIEENDNIWKLEEKSHKYFDKLLYVLMTYT